jgi:hypothetical protein
VNKRESAEVRDLKGGHADAGHMVNVINTINMINMINVEDLATGLSGRRSGDRRWCISG